MASDRPSSDIVFSVKPNAQTATNEASTETGSARPVITVERHELRNRNTTSTVSAAPSISASSTLAHRVLDARRRRRARRAASTPGRQRLLDLVDACADLARPPPWCCSRVGLHDVDADGFLVVVQRRRCAALRWRRARRRRRRAGPRGRCDCATTSCAKSAGASRRPLQPDGPLVELPFEPADRRGQVLRLQRLHDLRRR